MNNLVLYRYKIFFIFLFVFFPIPFYIFFGYGMLPAVSSFILFLKSIFEPENLLTNFLFLILLFQIGIIYFIIFLFKKIFSNISNVNQLKIILIISIFLFILSFFKIYFLVSDGSISYNFLELLTELNSI